MRRIVFLTATSCMLACHAAPAQTRAAAPTHTRADGAFENATQLVVVTTPAWDSTSGELRRFIRADAHSAWRPTGSTVPIVVGRTGLAWGVGFDEQTGPHKHEGDGRSPAGIFPLQTAFGFATSEAVTAAHAVRLPYVQLTPSSDCVDDTASVHYNAVVDRNTVPRVDWSSAEHMRQVAEYRLGVIIDYNWPAPVKSRGSCIFFHIWDGPRSSTAGCTALDAPELERLVAWLDPRAHPVVAQMPADVYQRVWQSWRLPVIDPAR